MKMSKEFWNLRDKARKATQWKPVVKVIANHYEKARRRMDCVHLREGKERRRAAKCKNSGHTDKIPVKRVRWA